MKLKINKNMWISAVMGGFLFAQLGLVIAAPPRGAGRAIIAGKSGDAFVRYPQGTVHQYPAEQQKVREGDAFTDGHILQTADGGRLCVVLTPGAVLCLNEDTNVRLNHLREMPDGLPSKEQDVVRTINLSLDKGGILFYGGQPSLNNRFRIKLPDGQIDTTGATFEISKNDGFWNLVVQEGEVTLRDKTSQHPVVAGETGSLGVVDGKSVVQVRKTSSGDKAAFDDYELCDNLYTFLNPLVFRLDGVDVDGLADFVGDEVGLNLLGDPTAWTDVSPSQPIRPVQRATGARTGQPWERGRLMPRQEIWNWYRELGAVKGVNYIPRTAVNAIEMWQAESFDADLIDEELGWAQNVGYGSVRVPLSFTVWKDNPDAFVDRMEEFLDLVDRNHLRAAFVLMDDTRRSKSAGKLGPQPEPIPGVYNSQWVPSPGPEYVVNPKRWKDIEKYVRGVVSAFKKDDRVLFWDVYHTPGNDRLWDRSLPLLESAFAWARDEDPQQPLTAGPWMEYASPMSVRIMELSDFISLQSFDDVEGVKSKLHLLSQFNRPIICTDWLKRQSGSTFTDILPLFAENKIGWFNRGLVQGRTQLNLPDDRVVNDGEGVVWQQDVLKEDGTPYDDEEIRQIRAFDFK